MMKPDFEEGFIYYQSFIVNYFVHSVDYEEEFETYCNENNISSNHDNIDELFILDSAEIISSYYLDFLEDHNFKITEKVLEELKKEISSSKKAKVKIQKKELARQNKINKEIEESGIFF